MGRENHGWRPFLTHQKQKKPSDEAERNQMALWDSCYFLNHFIIKVSVPNYSCDSRELLKTLKRLPSHSAQVPMPISPQKCIHLDKPTEHLRPPFLLQTGWQQYLLLRVAIKLIQAYKIVFFLFFSLHLLIISKTQSRISWTATAPKH